jgi:hypothetical protein
MPRRSGAKAGGEGGLKLAYSRYAESLTLPSPFLKGEASPSASAALVRYVESTITDINNT